MREDFEKAAVVLQEACPVAAKLSNSKRNIGNISGVGAEHIVEYVEPRQGIIASAQYRSGIGQTGVHFRFYEKSEYQRLNSEQKKELAAWRKTPEGIAATEAGKAARAAKCKETQQKHAAKKQKKFKEAVAAEVAAVFQQIPTNPPVAPAPTPAPAPQLPPEVQAAYATLAEFAKVSLSEAQPPEEKKTPTAPEGPNPWPLLPGILKKAKNP